VDLFAPFLRWGGSPHGSRVRSLSDGLVSWCVQAPRGSLTCVCGPGPVLRRDRAGLASSDLHRGVRHGLLQPVGPLGPLLAAGHRLP